MPLQLCPEVITHVNQTNLRLLEYEDLVSSPYPYPYPLFSIFWPLFPSFVYN